jgi:hypothetical protein
MNTAGFAMRASSKLAPCGVFEDSIPAVNSHNIFGWVSANVRSLDEWLLTNHNE